MDLSQLKRFEGLENQRFQLMKIGSKRRSRVGVGQYERGEFSLHVFAATDDLPEQYGVKVEGNGLYGYIRTSPVVKIVDADENSTTFETEGGVYKLEKI